MTIAVALLALCCPLSAALAGKTYTFEGQYTAADWNSYRYHPFQVPEGTTTIRVHYDYAADDGKKATLEIGIRDPDGFRGWSGAKKKDITVSESRDLTTDSYVAGEMPAGEWKIELGIPGVEPEAAMMMNLIGRDTPARSSTVSYTVTVELSGEPAGDPWVVPPKRDVTISAKPGWYRGDLHCHSTHSDGKYPLGFTLDFAHGQGLDFIATTEHNSVSHFSHIQEMQERYDDMLILYGIEYTSYIGHANVFDYPYIMDYRATNPGYDINAVIDEIHEGGGYFSPNHPTRFLGLGIPFWIDDIDWSKADFYEVWNGADKVAGFIPHPVNIKAINKWDKLLRQGYRITAVGGSDDHEAGQNPDLITATIGIPTTVVYAESLSTGGIIGGLAKGHVYILNQGPESDIAIDFTASGGGENAMMGDRIAADSLEYKVSVKNAKWKTLVIVENGIPVHLPILSDDYEHTFKKRPRSDGYIRLEVKKGPYHHAITNPIYYAPGLD